MTRSRLAVLVSTVVVVVGVIAGLGALWLDPARAAVGPMPGEALVLPADARFVMGFDVKRFTASPFYARYASQRGMKPEALRELEEKTGLNPARDVDQIVVVGGKEAARSTPGLALALGRFDLYKIGRALETEGKVTGHNVAGISVYVFKQEDARSVALAFLDETALLFGPRADVEAAIGSRSRGETPFKKNTLLLALVEKVRPGSTFWMVGDQSLLAGMPTSVPWRIRRRGHDQPARAPGADRHRRPRPAGLAERHRRGEGRARGDEPGRRGARLRRAHEPAGPAEAGALAARLRLHRGHRGEPRARLRPHPLRAAGRSPAEGEGGAGAGEVALPPASLGVTG